MTTTLADVLAALEKATPGEFAGFMRKDGSMYISVGDAKLGPHNQGDVHLTYENVSAMVSAANYLRANAGRLADAMRLLELFEAAETIELTDCNNPNRQLPNNPWAVTWDDFPTRKVRIIPDDAIASGGGEG